MSLLDCDDCGGYVHADDEGNPEICMGGPKESPDCPDCCDKGFVLMQDHDGNSFERQCLGCNPTDEDVAANTAAHEALVAAGGWDEEPF